MVFSYHKSMSEEIICAITPPNSPVRHYEEEVDKEIPACNGSFPFIWFSCTGEAKLEKIDLSDDSYIKNEENQRFEDFEYLPSNVSGKRNINLFEECFDFGSVFLNDCKTLFRMSRGELIFLQDATKLNHKNLFTYSELQSTQAHMKARSHCVKLFLYIREYLRGAILPEYNWILARVIPNLEENLSSFRIFLHRITNLPEHVLHHAAHTQGNKCLEASYHLFHCYLDMMWLHLVTLYQLCRCRSQMEANMPTSHQTEHVTLGRRVSLEQSMLALVADLVQLAVLRFEKIDIRTLLIKSPFSCNCVAELWLMLQVFSKKLYSQGILDNFWSFVNKVLEELIMTKGNGHRQNNCMYLTQSVTHHCKNTHAFTLWLLCGLAMLQTFDDKDKCSNYQLLESVVKGLLSSEVSEAHMRVYLTFIEKILIRYWEPKSDVIILLWEHFQKRLNSTFFVPGSSIDSMAIMSESVIGMIKQVKSRLSSNGHCEDSFQMFLKIIGQHLQKVSGQSQHWKQLRGRIYSKLSASKMQSLTEVGLYHISSLFLTLAVTADLNEVAKKLQCLLGCLSEAEMEINTRRLVWRTQLSVCFLFAERGLDFTSFISPLTDELDKSACTPHQDITLFRTYVDGVKDILESCPCSKIDHNILIGNWIKQYLADCSSNDALRLLELLQIMVQRVLKQPVDQAAFQNNLWSVVAPYMRVKVCEESPLQLADICINLCLLSDQGGGTLKEILQLFINNNVANIGLVRRFLSQLVQHKELLSLMNKISPSATDSCDVLIIKGWIHCSLLSLDFKNSELCKVTNYITYLPFVADICMDLPTATDPLVHFIMAVSNKFKIAKDIIERSSLRQRMSCYFNGMEKWVEPFIKQPKSSDIIHRIYHVVGLLVSHMPTLIYVKSRPITVLKGLLDVMFLPMRAYKPDYEPNPYIKGAITKNIHLYINGLGDLGSMRDAYIERCIEDLVRIYLPWVVEESSCRLQECVEKRGTAHLVLSATCSAFMRRKASTPHPHCYQALKFFMSIVKTYSRDFPVIREVVDCCFEQLCDVIMFCDEIHRSKNMARDVLVSIFECHSFNDELSEKIITKFEHLCREHLPFLPGKLFGLFHEVLRHRPELVFRFLPTLLNHIKIVESKRGISFDQSLRAYNEKLEKALERIRNGV